MIRINIRLRLTGFPLRALQKMTLCISKWQPMALAMKWVLIGT
jgi:hypothetical protein